MKSLKFLAVLLFPFFASANTHTTIVQNTSASNLLIYYANCNYYKNGHNICEPIKTFTLTKNCSNYQNPIKEVIQPGSLNQIHIVKIIDTVSGNSKYFEQYECSVNSDINEQNKTDFLTLSSLVDDPKVFICSSGGKK